VGSVAHEDEPPVHGRREMDGAPDAVAQAWKRIQFTSEVSRDLIAKSVQDGKDAGFLKGSIDTSKLIETP